MRSRFGPGPPPGEGGEGERGCGPLFGGLFGRHGHGPFARWRGARLFDSGALRLVVLGLIAEAPRHGYDIIRALSARFQGSYSPSPGAIYPILQMLAGAGLVSSAARGPRRLFTITEAGKAYLAEQQGELDAINAQLEAAAAPIGRSAIGAAIEELRAALFAKMRRGALTDEQARKLRDLLVKARDDVERL